MKCGVLLLCLWLAVLRPVSGAELTIQLPPEVNAFKQDAGAEIANGQCLVCHSVEYITTQPPFPRAFWKSSVQKMQQKYGAAIPDDQVEPLVDYLTRNYGVQTNTTATPSTTTAITAPSGTSEAAISPAEGPKIAARYGCLGCHNPDLKIVGPAYKEIAAKYKADADASAKVKDQIHKGGSGKWGPIIMPPFPQVSEAETKALANWILGIK